MEVLERTSRVVGVRYFSRNASGIAGDDVASLPIDQNWIDFQDDVVAVLKTFRAPPASITNVKDAALWGLAIQSALGPRADR